MAKRGKQKPTNRTVSKQTRRFRRRVRWTFLLALVVAGLYVYDRSGPAEKVQGHVAATSTYVHDTGAAGNRHTHIEAVLEFDGARHSVRPADDLSRGDLLVVQLRRGRLTGIRRYDSYRKE